MQMTQGVLVRKRAEAEKKISSISNAQQLQAISQAMDAAIRVGLHHLAAVKDQVEGLADQVLAAAPPEGREGLRLHVAVPSLSREGVGHRMTRLEDQLAWEKKLFVRVPSDTQFAYKRMDRPYLFWAARPYVLADLSLKKGVKCAQCLSVKGQTLLTDSEIDACLAQDPEVLEKHQCVFSPSHPFHLNLGGWLPCHFYSYSNAGYFDSADPRRRLRREGRYVILRCQERIYLPDC